MKRAILVILLVLVLSLLLVPVASAEVTHGRVVVCRNGHTQTVNSRAAALGFTHGSLSYGACEQ